MGGILHIFCYLTKIKQFSEISIAISLYNAAIIKKQN